MKKFILGMALLAGSTLAVQAQKVEKPIFGSVTVGGGLALGDFAKAGTPPVGGNWNGHTNYGVVGTVQGGYLFHEYIGAAASFSYGNFFGNTNKYNEENIKKSGTNSTTEISNAETKDFTTNTIAFQVGPRFRAQTGSVEFYLQPMVGFGTVGSATIKSNYREQPIGRPISESTVADLTVTTPSTSGLVWSSALGFRTGLGSNVGFTFDLAYTDFGARSGTYKADLKETGANNFSETRSVDTKSATSFFSVNFGVSVGF